MIAILLVGTKVASLKLRSLWCKKTCHTNEYWYGMSTKEDYISIDCISMDYTAQSIQYGATHNNNLLNIMTAYEITGNEPKLRWHAVLLSER